MFKGLMVGISGIRGVVGVGMTPEIALFWSGGFGSWIKGGKVIVGRDSRPSGVMLNHAVLAGLSAAGCDVDDVGVVPTPTAALAVKKRGASGGIIITASHNPQEWNAMKFVRSDGRMLTIQDFKELEKIVRDGPLRSASWDRLGIIREWKDAAVSYLSSVTGLGILDLDRIQKKRLKVVVDCVNSAGSVVYPDLLDALGCQVTRIYSDGSGIFPRPPEPLPQNLTKLCETVKHEKCDIGFAVDPDGDRLAVVDEKGIPIGEELTLALVVETVLQVKKGPVVVNSLTTQAVEDVAGKYGVECHRTRVGEANVSARMNEVNSVVGGEGNGGIIFPELHMVRDAGIGMAIIINRLSSGKKTISQIADDLPSYKMLKTAVPVGKDDPEELIERIAKLYEHDQVSRIDGVRVVYDDGWVQVRSSNTEPILRVFAEANNDQRTQILLNEMLSRVKQVRRKGYSDG